MPRRYSMERRTAAVDETRQRIIDATVQLHDEKGIVATSMQDVAARAGVSLGTVYRHFPSLDELVPACGGRIMELMPLPGADVFADLEGGPARLQALLFALYQHYEEAQRPYFVASAEAEHVPALQRFVEENSARIRGLLAAALEPSAPADDSLRLARAMADFRTWHAFHDAGFTSPHAAETAAQLVVSRLSSEGSNA